MKSWQTNAMRVFGDARVTPSQQSLDIQVKAFKIQGVKFGRKCIINRKKFRELHQNGTGATAIAKQMKIGRSTVYKLLKQTK